MYAVAPYSKYISSAILFLLECASEERDRQVGWGGWGIHPVHARLRLTLGTFDLLTKNREIKTPLERTDFVHKKLTKT